MSLVHTKDLAETATLNFIIYKQTLMQYGLYSNLKSARFANFLLTAIATELQGVNKQQEEVIESQMEQLPIFFAHNTWVFCLELRKRNIMLNEMKSNILDLEKW